jgi:hypothetical protein
VIRRIQAENSDESTLQKVRDSVEEDDIRQGERERERNCRRKENREQRKR